MRKRIVITGLGCISPLGNDVNTTWNNLLQGTSIAARISHFDPSDFKNQIAAEVKDFDPVAIFGKKQARRMDRFSQFALFSAQQAVEDSGLKITADNRDRIGAVIGSAIGGLGTMHDQFDNFRAGGPRKVSPFLVPLMLADTAGGMVAIHYGIRGPNLAVVTACATGTNSIGEAAEVIRRGHADVMLAGGAEAAILPITVAGLGSMTALTSRNDDPEHASRPFDKERDGFLIGEGAAVMVLESLEHAEDRGAKILGELSGYGVTNDAYHISAPAEKGAGAALCMQMALDDAGLEVTDIDYINAHGTSTPLNDKNETEAIKTVFGERAYDIPVSSTKSMTGHMLGASGAMEAMFGVKVLQDKMIPPTINYENPDPECDLDYVPNTSRKLDTEFVMSNSFGFGGHNATVILRSFTGASA
jgi:3-oxoacyl-[acyl-carrier-protein] synthase II